MQYSWFLTQKDIVGFNNYAFHIILVKLIKQLCLLEHKAVLGILPPKSWYFIKPYSDCAIVYTKAIKCTYS